MLTVVLVEPHKPAGVDHLGGLQAGAAKLPHDLPEGEVGVARHRRLQNGRIDDQRSDLERPDRKGGVSFKFLSNGCHAAILPSESDFEQTPGTLLAHRLPC